MCQRKTEVGEERVRKRRGHFIPETSRKWPGRGTVGKWKLKRGREEDNRRDRKRKGGRYQERERQRVSVTILSGIYCAREVYILL